MLSVIIFETEIAYFNPNTKDVIPGVSPQVLQIKVSKYQVLQIKVSKISGVK